MLSSEHPHAPTVRTRSRFAATGAIVACLIAALVLASSIRAASGTRQGADLQTALDSLVAGGVPGTILLVRDGSKTTRLTSGVADLSTKRAIRPGDRYRIASLAKTYVATVVLQLVGEGKLRMNDSVERWLPGVVPNGANIRIRHLLGHTSGLFDFENDPRLTEPYFGGDFAYYWSPRERLALATSHDPLYPPGKTSKATYSNTNYTVLGLIVEAATGKRIDVEVRRRIFEPLKLTATTFPDRKTTIDGQHAKGYYLLGQPPLVDVTEFSPSITGAGGAIVSTVGDVARFYRALLEGRLLPPNLLREMQRTLPIKSDVKSRMGLGLARYPTPCGVAWGHSGAFPGYLNYVFTSPDAKRQIVLMTNSDVTAMTPGVLQQFSSLLYTAYCSTK